MIRHQTRLFGLTGIAVAMLAGCANPVGPPVSPPVLPPPPPPPASTTPAPVGLTGMDGERAAAEARLRAWEARLQQQQAELDRRQQELDLAAAQARPRVAPAPTSEPQFPSQSQRIQPQSPGDTAPLPPATIAIPGAPQAYVPPVLPSPTYSSAVPAQPVTPPPADYGGTPYSAHGSEPYYQRGGIYGRGGLSTGSVYVRGYLRRDGTYVRPHFRRRSSR